jgi:hypothetical protein
MKPLPRFPHRRL